MNRRAARRLAPIRLLIALLAFVALVGHGDVVIASPPEPPPVTANEFFPEDRDLSDCVGALERPGCGSEERGGPLLNLVFVLVIAGMAFIFWRIIVGVRKNRAELERAQLERTELERTETERTDTDRTDTERTDTERTDTERTETIDP